MKTLVSFGAFLVCVLLTGCGTTDSSAPSEPLTTSMPRADVMRIGDKITIQLAGVPDEGWIHEYQIPSSGDITVPLLTQSFHAAGQNVAQLASELTEAYKSQKIYTNPVVTVLAEERYVNVGGEVRSPSRIVYSADSTVMSSINSCGGFTEYANKHAVSLIRGSQRFTVDCVSAAQSPGADPAVYPGDQITVPRTMF